MAAGLPRTLTIRISPCRRHLNGAECERLEGLDLSGGSLRIVVAVYCAMEAFRRR